MLEASSAPELLCQSALLVRRWAFLLYVFMSHVFVIMRARSLYFLK